MNEKVQALIDYITELRNVGLDSKQMYSRHARACNEIEEELGIKTKDDD